MNKCLYTSVLLFAVTLANAQTEHPTGLADTYVKRLETVEVPMRDSSALYVGDAWSEKLFYQALVPEKIKGTLVLLPGGGEVTENVFLNNTRLLQTACDSGLLVIVPSLNFNLALDGGALRFLDLSFGDITRRYQAPADKIVLGGFSLGGLNAIRYTELAHEKAGQTAIVPRAVYAIDPPLDWARMYHSFTRAMTRNFSAPAVQEAQTYLQMMDQLFGGPPEKFPEPYIRASAYSRGQENGGNARFLANVPLRIYSDPDISWYLENRRADYYDINASDQSAMINVLLQLGNKNAEFVTALGSGYRLGGKRHPHSWSVAEPVKCLEWILSKLHVE